MILPKVELRPVSRRVLSSLYYQIRSGKSAFYLGAGTDLQLVQDAGVKKEDFKNLSWGGLLESLAPFGKISPDDLKAYLALWPTETASILRWGIGDRALSERVYERTKIRCKPNIRSAFTRSFCSLLLKSNLIVTTNYTSHAVDSLQSFIQANSLNKRIVTIDREELGSFPFPSVEKDPEIVYFVYLHGRCSIRSFPVFDAWGYNVAMYDDPHYRLFLNNLFARRHVISIGTSWQDVPLRNEAALVYRTLSYLRPNHLALQLIREPNRMKRALVSSSPERKWSNVMRADYGINILPVNSSGQTAVLDQLSRVASPRDPDSIKCNARSDLPNVARFLDACGDYESTVQQYWFVNALPKQPNDSDYDRVKRTVTKLTSLLLDHQRIHADVDWVVAARIERHLRHCSYLYDGASKRTTLWRAVIEEAKKNWADIANDSRLQFDILCGQHELHLSKVKGLRRLRISDPIFAKRLRLAPDVWTKKRRIRQDSLNLVTKLLELGWESMASKVVLDLAYQFARQKRVSGQQILEIIDLAARAEAIARSVGCFRRQVKAEVLISLWTQDPNEGRQRILNRLRAAQTEQNNFVRSSQGHYDVEPALFAGFAAGFFCNHIKDLGQRYTGEKLEREIRVTKKPLLSEAGNRCFRSRYKGTIFEFLAKVRARTNTKIDGDVTAMTAIEKNIFSSGGDKLLSFPETIRSWQERENFVPVTLEIQPTEICNHRCPGCQAQYVFERSELRSRARSGVELDINILDTVWERPPRGVVISGNTGDPLLYSKIPRLLQLLREKAIPTVLITNGQAFTKDIAELAVQCCSGIRISLDAHDEVSFRRTHGVRGCWDAVLENIRILVKVNAMKDPAGNKCWIGVGYLTSHDNRGGMLSATRLACELSLDYIQFRPFHYEQHSFDNEIQACRELERLPNFSVLSSTQKYERIGDPTRPYDKCHGSSFYTVLDSRGDFYICCHHVGNPRAKVGSLHEGSWNDFVSSDLRKKVTARFGLETCPPLCRLDSQNRVLEIVKQHGVVPVAKLRPEVQQHAVFL